MLKTPIWRPLTSTTRRLPGGIATEGPMACSARLTGTAPLGGTGCITRGGGRRPAGARTHPAARPYWPAYELAAGHALAPRAPSPATHASCCRHLQPQQPRRVQPHDLGLRLVGQRDLQHLVGVVEVVVRPVRGEDHVALAVE